MKSIFDKDFKYTPAIKTDIRQTFDRVRREQAEKAKQAPVKLDDRRKRRG